MFLHTVNTGKSSKAKRHTVNTAKCTKANAQAKTDQNAILFIQRNDLVVFTHAHACARFHTLPHHDGLTTDTTTPHSLYRKIHSAILHTVNIEKLPDAKLHTVNTGILLAAFLHTVNIEKLLDAKPHTVHIEKYSKVNTRYKKRQKPILLKQQNDLVVFVCACASASAAVQSVCCLHCVCVAIHDGLTRRQKSILLIQQKDLVKISYNNNHAQTPYCSYSKRTCVVLCCLCVRASTHSLTHC